MQFSSVIFGNDGVIYKRLYDYAQYDTFNTTDKVIKRDKESCIINYFFCS